MIHTQHHSPKAEVALLGGVLVVGEAVLEVQALGFEAEDFYNEAHRHIWRSIERLAKASGGEGNCGVDVVTVMTDLHHERRLDAVGGFAYLSQLSAEVPTAANVTYYAKIVRGHANARRAMALLNESQHLLAVDPREVSDKIAEVGSKLGELAAAARERSTCEAEELWKATIASLEAARDRGGMVGMPSGLAPWDRLTSGLFSGRQHIVAGRPGMGKSALASWLVQQWCAARVDTPWRRAVVISVEMTKDELGQRWGSNLAGVTRQQLAMDDRHFAKLFEHMPDLIRYPFNLNDSDHVTALDIDASCRETLRSAEKHADKARKAGIDAEAGIDLIVVDYLTRLAPSTPRRDRRTEIDETVQALSSIAKRYDAPMITLAQLNRAVEMRADKRPMLSDLRETGTIEQEAYTVTFLYRGEYYDDDKALPNTVELIVAKNRGGRTGTAVAGCNLAYNRFYEGVSDRPEPPPPIRRTPQGPSPEQRNRPAVQTPPPPKPAPPSPPIPSEPNPNHTTLGGKIPPSPF